MKGHHGAEPVQCHCTRNAFRACGGAPGACPDTSFAVRQLQPRAKRAADGVTEAVCALGRAELHSEQGNLFLKRLSHAPAQSNSWWTSSLLGYLTSHVSAGTRTSCNWLTDVFLPILMRDQGPRVAAPRNGRTTKVPSLCLFDPAPGIAPQEDLAAEANVFPLRGCYSWLRFFRGGAQTTRTGSGCFLWTGQPADCEGHLQPFLRKSPETANVREGPQDYVRTESGLHNGELVNDFRVSPDRNPGNFTLANFVIFSPRQLFIGVWSQNCVCFRQTSFGAFSLFQNFSKFEKV